MNPVPAAGELLARPTQPLTDDTFARLNEWECRWRDRQQFLESRGYMDINLAGSLRGGLAKRVPYGVRMPSEPHYVST